MKLEPIASNFAEQYTNWPCIRRLGAAVKEKGFVLSMASKKTLNQENLVRLGAENLAALLIEITAGNAAFKRRLRLELAGEVGAKEVAREVHKRLKTIAKATSFIDWTKAKAFADDLDTQRRMIVEKVAPDEPAEGFQLLWQFLNLAPSVYERCDDSSGYIRDIFYDACGQLGVVGRQANLDGLMLAQQVFDATCPGGNDYGQFDGLIESLGEVLGDTGLNHLKDLVTNYGNEPVPPEPRREDYRMNLGGGRFGYSLDRDFAKERRARFVRSTLQQIADQQGDVDSYIAQEVEDTATSPYIAADIATRLLSVGRAEEALKYLDAATDGSTHSWQFNEWNDARIATLDALGQTEEAKQFLWQCFQKSLETKYLRDLTKRLPDFDDVECEERAFKWAAAFPDVHQALHFFVKWPALEQGANLIVDRADDIDGNHYELLTPAADALQGRYPLAATLIRRSMIDFSLKKARSSRYKHAARHLLECQSAHAVLDDYGKFVSHDDYLRDLRQTHGKKSSFWSLLPPDI